ncbi:MAG: FxsA family protein [Deltaproteobacteria bacterium]|nr:FxsA family protein [Deltaproteobacteria bacterium]
MALLLLVAFIAVPIVEIMLLIKVGGLLGTWPVIALCIGTGVLGAWLAKSQGGATYRAMVARVHRGEVPAGELVDMMLLMMSGALLMTPGFVTDGVGFLLLVPAFRKALRGFAWEKMKSRATFGFYDGRGPRDPFGGFGGAPPRSPWSDREPPVREDQPDVEVLPPGRAPEPPRPPRPRVIDVD